MTATRKVIWAEGILLTQQHFQQWENYHQQQHYFLMNSFSSYPWGLCELIIDEDLLSNGMLMIQKCKIIFPSGIIIQYDAAVAPPLCYQMTTNANQQIDIFLCLPLGQKVSNISGYAKTDMVNTWYADYQIIPDVYDNTRQQEILFARPNLIILSNHDKHEHYEIIKICEIAQASLGKYKLSKKFIPPMVMLQASELLQNICKRWIEYIASKIRLLKDCYQQLQQGTPENNQLERIYLLLLQSLSQTIVILCHYTDMINTHPEYLYRVLISLISTLSIFDLQYDVSSLPKYNHSELYIVFEILEQSIKSLLENAIPSPMGIIMLNRINDTLYVVEAIDSKFFDNHHFYLSVKFESTDQQWVEQFQCQIKLSASSRITVIAALAVAGVKVNYTQRLPQKLSIKPGCEYFYIEQSGEAWEQIKHERSLALFLPYTLSKSSIELITIAEK